MDDTHCTMPIDILLITTKAHHIRVAFEPYTKHITGDTLSIFLQNGIGAVDSVRDILPITWLVLEMTMHVIKWFQPDQIQWIFKEETLFLPEPPTILLSYESQVLVALGQIITFSDLEDRLYQKLALNVCINPVTAIYNVQNGNIADLTSPAHYLSQ